MGSSFPESQNGLSALMSSLAQTFTNHMGSKTSSGPVSNLAQNRTWVWQHRKMGASVEQSLHTLTSSSSASRNSFKPPRPLVSLNAPSQMPSPAKSREELIWPEGANIPRPLNDLLIYFACSDEGRHLLSTCPQQSSLKKITEQSVKAQQQQMTRLQYHLSAIVAMLRDPDVNHPLKKEYLEDLANLFTRHNFITPDSTDETLFITLCANLEADYSYLDQQEMFENLLPLPMSLSQQSSLPSSTPPKEVVISEDQIPLMTPDKPILQRHINTVLKFLTASPTATRWLWFASPNLNSRTDKTRIELRNHLVNIIGKLRSPSEKKPLSSSEIKQFETLINKCRGKETPVKTAVEMLEFLAVILNSTVEEFIEFSQFTTTMIPSLLPRPQTLAPATTILTDDITSINVLIDNFPFDLWELLVRLAGTSECDAMLLATLPMPLLSEDMGKCFSTITKVSQLRCLQQQLLGIVNFLRTVSGGPELAASAECCTNWHIDKLKSLLILAGCPALKEKIIRDWLLDTFQTSQAFSQSDEPSCNVLPPASNEVVSRPLPNLGSTCYMNSILQMMARYSYFDPMLTQKFTHTQPVTYEGEKEETYRQRCESSLREFNSTVQRKQALQSQLRMIIGMMRQPDSQSKPVDSIELNKLYIHLQVNGWDRQKFTQQDPQEFLAFLMNTLHAEIASIHTVDRGIYVKENERKSFTTPGTHFELSIPLPTDAQKAIDRTYNSMGALYEHYRHEMFTGYTPEGESTEYDVEKTSFIVDPAPESLFIQLKRFGYNGTSYRISGSVPLTPTFTIPLYDKDNLDTASAIGVYRLTTVICHHPFGGSNSASSGHYTVWALQKELTDNGESKEVWIHYDDKRSPEKVDAAIPLPEKLVSDLCETSYYLGYTLESAQGIDSQIAQE